jgi:hypothetical protein
MVIRCVFYNKNSDFFMGKVVKCQTVRTVCPSVPAVNGKAKPLFYFEYVAAPFVATSLNCHPLSSTVLFIGS